MKTAAAILFVLVAYALTSEAQLRDCKLTQINRAEAEIEFVYDGGKILVDLYGNRQYVEVTQQPVRGSFKLSRNYVPFDGSQYSGDVVPKDHERKFYREDFILDLYVGESGYLLKYRYLPASRGGLYKTIELGECLIPLN
jgi:hypothetical protein